MALVRVCDICRTELEKDRNIGYVEIDIYKPVSYSGLMFPTSVTLCEECFNCLLYTSPSPRDRG